MKPFVAHKHAVNFNGWANVNNGIDGHQHQNEECTHTHTKTNTINKPNEEI